MEVIFLLLICIMTASGISVQFASSSLCATLSPLCSSSLGLESGLLKDLNLSASSSYSSSVMPQMGRLNSMAGGGAWCPARVISNQSREWLEVDLGKEHTVTGVITQGRWDRGLGQEFAQHVMVQYWVEEGEEGEWRSAGGRREANIDTFTPVVIQLKTPVRTNRVRIVPVSHHPRTVCLRLEVCGCDEDAREIHDESDNIPDGVQDIPVITTSYMSLVIGVLVTIILLLTTVILCILYKNYTASQNHSNSVPKSEENYKVYNSIPPDSTSHYTDSSTEYASPLIVKPLSQHKVEWDTFSPPPPQQSHPDDGHSNSSNHYASTNIIYSREVEGKGVGHFL